MENSIIRDGLCNSRSGCRSTINLPYPHVKRTDCYTCTLPVGMVSIAKNKSMVHNVILYIMFYA